MKKFKKMLTSLMAVVMLVGVCCTTALPIAAENDDTTAIGPLSSPEIYSVDYCVNSSYYSSYTILKSNCTGSIYMELQKKSGSSYSYVTSNTVSFSRIDYVYNKHPYSIPSGTYRVKVVANFSDGHSDTRYSPDYTI